MNWALGLLAWWSRRQLMASISPESHSRWPSRCSKVRGFYIFTPWVRCKKKKSRRSFQWLMRYLTLQRNTRRWRRRLWCQSSRCWLTSVTMPTLLTCSGHAQTQVHYPLIKTSLACYVCLHQKSAGSFCQMGWSIQCYGFICSEECRVFTTAAAAVCTLTDFNLQKFCIYVLVMHYMYV